VQTGCAVRQVVTSLACENARICSLCKSFCNGGATGGMRTIGDDLHDEGSQTEVCSVTFTDGFKTVASFGACRQLLNVQWDRIWIRKENKLWERHSAVDVFLPASMLRTEPDSQPPVNQSYISTDSSMVKIRLLFPGWAAFSNVCCWSS